MIDVSTIAGRLCGDLVLDVAQRGDRSFVVSSFRYPDGDYVLIYFDNYGERDFATDRGTTLFKCTVDRIAITDARNELITSICRRYGVELRDGELRKPLSDNPGLDCLRFCEAITRVSNLQYETAKDRSVLSDEVADFLEREVSPFRKIQRGWTDPQIDPDGDYPVDYRLNGVGQPRNIFYVGSGGKSTLVSAVSSFLRLNRLFVPTLAIVDPEIHLGRHHVGRLQRATTEIRFGLAGYEKDVIEFSLEGMQQ